MIKPVRLQLSRRRGFDLQAVSLAANGVRAVNVARPGKFGNPLTLQHAREAGYLRRAPTLVEQHAFLRDCFRDWLASDSPDRIWWDSEDARTRRATILRDLETLRGCNIACWCGLQLPCHGDVYLELANR